MNEQKTKCALLTKKLSLIIEEGPDLLPFMVHYFSTNAIDFILK